MPFRLTRRAENDLEDIFVRGIQAFGEHQALKYQQSFSRTFELLAEMPGLGRESERKVEGELRFAHGSHVIYYRMVDEEEMLVVRIIYGPLIVDV